jgi:hypothetical protein
MILSSGTNRCADGEAPSPSGCIAQAAHYLPIFRVRCGSGWPDSIDDRGRQ